MPRNQMKHDLMSPTTSMATQNESGGNGSPNQKPNDLSRGGSYSQGCLHGASTTTNNCQSTRDTHCPNNSKCSTSNNSLGEPKLNNNQKGFGSSSGGQRTTPSASCSHISYHQQLDKVEVLRQCKQQ